MAVLVVRRAAAAFVFLAVPAVCSADPADQGYTTGEIALRPKNYVIGDLGVNAQARYLHNVDKLRKLLPGITLTGEGVVVGIWDGGLVQSNHQDFSKGQVLHKDTQFNDLDSHATHVAGTIAGTGKGRSEARGMATKATLWSFEYEHDMEEMLKLAKDGQVPHVSNHSYGFPAGWSKICAKPAAEKSGLDWVWAGPNEAGEDPAFGRYNSESVAHDALALAEPEWTQVISAGNTRNPILNPHGAKDIIQTGEYKWLASYDLTFSGEHKQRKCEGKASGVEHPAQDRYDSLPRGSKNAKNVITVGAMIDPPNPIDPATKAYRPLENADIRTTDFSSWGPTDDGRIKPDVIANGQEVLSLSIPEKCDDGGCSADDKSLATNTYVQNSGTSMATPVVTGTIALLNELSLIKRKTRLRSDEAKAILIHTARSASKGPTYDGGWGAIRADFAGRLLISKEEGESLRVLSVERSKVHKIKLKPSGAMTKRITLVWLDEPGTPSDALDDSTPRLVNDIDIRLERSEGGATTVVMPWKLDRNNPTAEATRGANHVDNVERIDVPADVPKGGQWTLAIEGHDWKSAKSLNVALAIWGFDRID